MNYVDLRDDFRAHHQHPLNIALHMISTPLGLIMAVRLGAFFDPQVTAGVLAVYTFTLMFFLPFASWLRTALLLALISWAGLSLKLEPLAAAALLVAAYFGQDLAHAIAGESTFESSYRRTSTWMRRFAEHTYFLLPLCADTAWSGGLFGAFFESCMPKSGLLTTKLSSSEERSDLRSLREWVLAQKPPEDTTTHWWAEKLDPAVRGAFERIAASPAIEAMFRARHGRGVFAIEPVRGMNEVYVASLSRKNNSDAVFYTPHIDGPFMIYPAATVYRCIVAVNENAEIKTIFPMTPSAATWTTGDVGAFDFNREPHYIERIPGAHNPELRITLKLHYCVYPRVFRPYGKLLGWLNTRYDVAARRAFLESLRPATFFERALAFAILLCTRSYAFLGKRIGGNNLLYLGTLAALDFTLDAPIFLYGTSFVHYLLYFGTYYTREGVSFHTFRRDAVLYKGLAIAQLALLYARNYHFDPSSLSLIAAGLGLSGLAAFRLGAVRTYFGAELGLATREKITAFPYGFLPHPMILGNIIALCGLMKLENFREAAPYLAPLHILFYVLHMLQEHFDVHRRQNPQAAG